MNQAGTSFVLVPSSVVLVTAGRDTIFVPIRFCFSRRVFLTGARPERRVPEFSSRFSAGLSVEQGGGGGGVSRGGGVGGMGVEAVSCACAASVFFACSEAVPLGFACLLRGTGRAFGAVPGAMAEGVG